MTPLFERRLLIGLLKAMKDGPVSRDAIREDLHITSEVLESFLSAMAEGGLISLEGDVIHASLNQKIRLAVKAVETGADLEHVGQVLTWLEFEEMTAKVFEENGFKTRPRFRFKAEGRFWEIDVLAYRRPLIACAECKHWLKGLGDSIVKVIETHRVKTEVFSGNLESLSDRIGLRDWDRGVILPMAITLTRSSKGIYEGVPVVSIIELPSFLNDVGGYLNELVHFNIDLQPSKPTYTRMKMDRWLKPPTG